ncbi:hypothetical protein GGP41_006417 [Bipolaris sorokiniana]|uniref:Uncharacterized protein n=1 Tax=Cochliobolus sativus TaxID=45130 RepID=A0A8H5ZJS4_COCSA|nr:hypothetical protein GGP41_006417 [Bipolaris sorokiniana]
MIQSPVFGLALVTEPSKCSTKGSGQARESERDEKKKKKKMKKMKKKDMGILPAEANFPRIITPVSETIVNGSIKYYRRIALGTACKCHASKTKKEAERTKITVSEPNNTKLPNTLTVTRPVTKSNAIFPQYCVWKITDDLKAAKAMRDTLIKLAPRLIKRPSNEGTVAFWDFSEIPKKEDAEKLVEEVKF